MCWTNYKDFIPHKVAKENITCYKIFKNKNVIYRKRFIFFGEKKIHRLYSLIRYFKYTPFKKQYHIDLYVDERLRYGSPTFETYYVIEEGYHSYATLDKANQEKERWKPSVIVECIIPKNAIYYINEEDEIVSSTIIVTDKIVN